MKNSLKRAASLIALGAIAASACSLNAFAEGDKYKADAGGYFAGAGSAFGCKGKLERPSGRSPCFRPHDR